LKVHNSASKFHSSEPIVLTIGTFDGVHAGHRAVIGVLKDKATEIGGKTALLTFHPHPRVILHPENHGLKLLNTLKERKLLLESAGLDHLIVQEFNKELSRLTPLDYVKSLLAEGIKPAVVVIGDDHRFGRNREGTFNGFVELGRMFGFQVIALEAEYVNDIRVSSTKIRTSISDGNLSYAGELLTKQFPLSGIVVEGQQIGRTLGFPTANLLVEDDLKIIPANGVYAVWSKTKDSKWMKAILNIGNRPTVTGSDSPSIEVHILDFTGDLYTKQVHLSFVERIRDEKKFENIEELKAAINRDKSLAEDILENNPAI
jgi:riboflavin kinase/FMN adenylyltransferase